MDEEMQTDLLEVVLETVKREEGKEHFGKNLDR